MTHFNRAAAVSLNLTLSGHTGEHIGFFHTGGNPMVKGWWEYKNGCEGGELSVDSRDGALVDFDGAGDLPKYVRNELIALGINIDVLNLD